FLYNHSHEIPHWEAYGSVIPHSEFIRLTPSVPNLRGGLWSRLPNPHKQWQVELAFRVDGRSYMGGDGFALWYTKERVEVGPVYGNRDAWHGLGVIFDTSDPTENRATPYIYAVYNDGSKRIAGQRATQGSVNGACFRDYRNLGVKTWARLTYANSTLRLDIDMKGGGKHYVECFTSPSFPDLPTNFYFGLTAQTTARAADDHDIFAFETYEAYPPGLDPSKLPKRPFEEDHEKKGQAFKMDPDVEKRLQDIEVQDDEGDGWSGDEEPEALTPQLAKTIQETQLKIIESLNALHSFVAGAPHLATRGAPAGEGGASGGAPNINTAILEHKIDELSGKLAQTENELRQVRELVGGNARKLDGIASRPGGGGPPAGAGNMAECQRMLSEIQGTLRSIGSQASSATSRMDERHQQLAEKTSSLTWYATVLGVVLFQFALSWAWSVVRGSRAEREKKFI
ncbi:concanavalin A-like lectin/glucanase domain-containing protein, partial [Hyaloraphidium curvatum]